MRVISQIDVNVSEIVEALKAGATIVYPTETCYGLGCDATNEAAVARLFAIKQRQLDKSMLLLMADTPMAREYVRWNPILNTLAGRYWPGPLTVVAALRTDVSLPAGVIGKERTAAFRVTSHPLAAALIRQLGRPLVSTSANIAAQESPYDSASVLQMFAAVSERPDIVIDAGVLVHRSPSTIVRVRGDQLDVLRQGEIVVEI